MDARNRTGTKILGPDTGSDRGITRPEPTLSERSFFSPRSIRFIFLIIISKLTCSSLINAFFSSAEVDEIGSFTSANETSAFDLCENKFLFNSDFFLFFLDAEYSPDFEVSGHLQLWLQETALHALASRLL